MASCFPAGASWPLVTPLLSVLSVALAKLAKSDPQNRDLNVHPQNRAVNIKSQPRHVAIR